MKKLLPTARVLALCMAAALAAPFVVVAFGVDWRDAITGRVFLTSVANSACIGLVAFFVLPSVVRWVGKPGLRMVLAYAGALVLVALVGTLAGSGFLLMAEVTPVRAFWGQYCWTARRACLLALAFGMSAFVYESLASRLREMRARLQAAELEKTRAQKLSVEARLSSLESRIHPHFLFNTLNSISSLIPVAPARAEEIVGQLSVLLRSSLDAAPRALVPLGSEMQIVKAYLVIQQARFGDRLRYRFNIPGETADLLVPPLSIQCLVDNAVKHAIAASTDPGEVRVIVRQIEAAVRIEVRDTGPGFELSRIDPGHGIDNLVAQLEVLFGSAACLDVARRDGWCTVGLEIPR